jgi:quercetin dioxygenase-like cupin family protein
MQTEIINNPITGETLYVLESNEEVFRIEFAIDPGKAIAAEHIHPFQDQAIYVIEGTLGCRIGDVNRFLAAGEYAIIPAGSSHYQWNPTAEEARAIEEIRPAGKAHNFFRVLFALAREGKTNSKGVPKPLIGAAFASEFKDFVRPTSVGLRFLFGLLGPVSILLGYRDVIRTYIERFEQDEMDRTPVISFNDTPAADPEYARSFADEQTTW